MNSFIMVAVDNRCHAKRLLLGVVSVVALIMLGSTWLLMHKLAGHAGSLNRGHEINEELLSTMRAVQQDIANVRQELRASLETAKGQMQGAWTNISDALSSRNRSNESNFYQHAQQQRQQQRQQQQQLVALSLQANATGKNVKEILKTVLHRRSASWPLYVGDTDLNVVMSANAKCTVKRGMGLHLPPSTMAPIVILAHDRVKYLAKTLMSVFKVWQDDPNNASKFPVVVSVDGDHQPTLLLLTSLKYAFPKMQIVVNIPNDDLCHSSGFCNLTWHYKMLLQLFFKCQRLQYVIFLEDDLEIAPDFFSYFEATANLLDKDKSLLCVSAWNDHGQEGRAADPTALYRTDIMPGLGWMIARSVALDLIERWPQGGWDEWMRRDFVRKNRQCIFPEVSRTHTFGNYGTSGGMFFKQHLDTMLLNQKHIGWSTQNLSYLHHDSYATLLSSWLRHAEPVTDKGSLSRKCRVDQSAVSHGEPVTDMIVTYDGTGEYDSIAKSLHPMLPDLQAESLPRASCNGTVIVRCQGRRLFISPKQGSPKPTGT